MNDRNRCFTPGTRVIHSITEDAGVIVENDGEVCKLCCTTVDGHVRVQWDGSESVFDQPVQWIRIVDEK